MCWGNNKGSQLGDGTTNRSLVPAKVLGLTNVTAVYAGPLRTCVRDASASVKRWGWKSTLGTYDHWVFPSFGIPAVSEYIELVPTAVPGLGAIKSISLGGLHACAVVSEGTVACWGNNDHGQLGDTTIEERRVPTPLANLGGAVVSLSAGGGFKWGHTCAIVSNGRAKCWGSNENGQIGDGTNTDRWTPVFVK